MHKHILINGVPKSGTLFLSRAIWEFLSCGQMRIATRSVTESQADAEAIHEFLALPACVAQQHIAPNDHNIRVLQYMGLTKFVLTLRDPRDVLVSFAHHMLRPDLNPWHLALVSANGIVPVNYYDLSWDEQLDALIEYGFPRFQNWITDWLTRSDHPALDVHVVNYDCFAANPRNATHDILTFFGHDIDKDDIHLPSVSHDNRKAGIDLSTHFRRGVSGGFRTELSDCQIQRLEKRLNRDLYAQMSWTI